MIKAKLPDRAPARDWFFTIGNAITWFGGIFVGIVFAFNIARALISLLH